MGIIAMFEDTYSLIKTIIAGDRIDVLWGGEIRLLCLIITVFLCIKAYKKGSLNTLKAIMSAAAVYLYIYLMMPNIGSIKFKPDNFGFLLGYDDGVVLGQFWRPFYLMTSLSEVLDIYIMRMIYYMLIAFIFTITFKHLYKLWQFLLFYICTFGWIIIVILLKNQYHNGASVIFDLGIPIVALPSMLAGWGLSRILIALNRSKYDKLHAAGQAHIKQNQTDDKSSVSLKGISQVRHLCLILSEIIRDKRSGSAVAITLYLTITVSFISIFTCFRVLEKNKQIYDDIDLASKAYNDVFINTESFQSSSDFLSALDTASEEYGISYTGLNVQLDEMPLYFDVEGLGRVDDSFMLISDSISSGEIHINEKALYNGMPLKVGDECSIGGKSFTVTEVGQMTELYLNDLSSIKVGMEDLSISFDSIVTSEILDKTQKEELESILGCSELISKQDSAAMQNKSVSADQKLICLLITVLSVLVIVSLFKQVMLSSSKRIAMFRLYGAKDIFIASFFIIYIFEYIAVSFIAAMAVYKLCGGVFNSFYLEAESSVSMKAYAFGIVFLLSVIFDLPQFIIMLKKKPAQLAVRR